MGTVPLNNNVEFLLRKCPLIELPMLPIKNREDIIVVGMLGHVDIALQVSHKDAVPASFSVVRHNQVFVVGVDKVALEFE